MGATNFETYAEGTDVAAAFTAAVEQAEFEHGHSGYTGSIAEKDEFLVISGVDPLPLADARKLARTILDSNPLVDDKYGPAGAIPVLGEARTVEVTVAASDHGGWKTTADAVRAALGETLGDGETIEDHRIWGVYETDDRTRLITSGQLTAEITGGSAHTGWLFFGMAAE